MASDDGPLAGYLPLAQAAPRLDVTERTLKRMIIDGRIAAIKHANRLWIANDEINDYFAKLKAQGARRRANAAKKARTATTAKRAAS